MRWPGALVALVLTVGIAGTAIALKSREGDTQFVARQQDLVPVGPAALERLIVTTSDPRPGYAGLARGARCTLWRLERAWRSVDLHGALSAAAAGALPGDRLRGPLDLRLRSARRASPRRPVDGQRVLRGRAVGSGRGGRPLNRARRAACAARDICGPRPRSRPRRARVRRRGASGRPRTAVLSPRARRR